MVVLSCVTSFLVQPLLVRFCKKQFAPSSLVYISEKEYQDKTVKCWEVLVIILNCILVHFWQAFLIPYK